MTESTGNEVQRPRMVETESWRVAGLQARYTYEQVAGLPGQWKRFAGCMNNIPEQTGAATYGVMLPVAGLDGFDYLTGVAIAGDTVVPEGFSEARMPAARYAVFEHRGHVADIRQTWTAVWERWLEEAGCEVADKPVLFERYGEDFDPATGQGVVGLWVPVR